MTQRAALQTVLDETCARVAANPDIAAFADDALQPLAYVPQQPRALPVTRHLAETAPPGNPATDALRRSIVDAIPYASWEQSYSEDQVGASYLAQYGFFNLVSPNGPFVSDTMRVSIGVWGAGLVYPPHTHRPEELYVVLAGSAVFHTEGRDPVSAVPETLIHHPSNVRHGFSVGDQGVLLIAFWRGSDLLAISRMESDS